MSFEERFAERYGRYLARTPGDDLESSYTNEESLAAHCAGCGDPIGALDGRYTGAEPREFWHSSCKFRRSEVANPEPRPEPRRRRGPTGPGRTRCRLAAVLTERFQAELAGLMPVAYGEVDLSTVQHLVSLE